MKKFIHLKRIMIQSGEEYGLGFPTSPKTPNSVSYRMCCFLFFLLNKIIISIRLNWNDYGVKHHISVLIHR